MLETKSLWLSLFVIYFLNTGGSFFLASNECVIVYMLSTHNNLL